jgi:hypothetical protein
LDGLFQGDFSMRPIIAPAVAVVIACMALAGCGSTERKTVVVTPPAGSTTVVDQDGRTHVVPPAGQ